MTDNYRTFVIKRVPSLHCPPSPPPQPLTTKIHPLTSHPTNGAITMTSLASIVESIQVSNESLEFDWITNDIIVPEFAAIVEALSICSDLILNNSPQHPNPEDRIERGPAIKLPVSLLKLETIKGIVIRDGAYITDLSLHIRDPYFNRVVSRLVLKQPVLLPQIITAKRSIDAAITLINECSHHECHDHPKLVQIFETIRGHLQTAKTALQLPTDPELVFPKHVTATLAFEPELTAQLAIDIYINQAELCVDLKFLHVVNEHPWGDLSPLGQSYIDMIKDEIQQGKQPLDAKHIDQRIHQLATNDGDGLFFSNILNMIKPRYDPIDYLTKCVTFNRGVVMILKQVEVALPDPVLVSAFTKLDSVEYLVTRFLDNLNAITK